MRAIIDSKKPKPKIVKSISLLSFESYQRKTSKNLLINPFQTVVKEEKYHRASAKDIFEAAKFETQKSGKFGRQRTQVPKLENPVFEKPILKKPKIEPSRPEYSKFNPSKLEIPKFEPPKSETKTIGQPKLETPVFGHRVKFKTIPNILSPEDSLELTKTTDQNDETGDKFKKSTPLYQKANLLSHKTAPEPKLNMSNIPDLNQSESSMFQIENQEDFLLQDSGFLFGSNIPVASSQKSIDFCLDSDTKFLF
ncbi:hypothetical protein RF11_11598 [Thelohanellus kitauei]|uniref:Uncharacterized protein n=1 Tax=Thelohanellus kitauei TaxID=669202 RepID=A0A0C2JK68_THEKT|nr:hypothetical protein RF11_11598 [Thelohanellus kitauei]